LKGGRERKITHGRRGRHRHFEGTYLQLREKGKGVLNCQKASARRDLTFSIVRSFEEDREKVKVSLNQKGRLGAQEGLEKREERGAGEDGGNPDNQILKII